MRKPEICIALSLVVTVAWASMGFSQTAQSSAQRLDAFYSAEWEYQLQDHPELATFIGDSRFNDRLSDYSPIGAVADAEHARAQLKIFAALPTDGLTAEQKISREMMLRELTATIDAYQLKEWEMPVSQKNGVHLDVAGMYAQMPFNTAQDYRNYIARMKAVPRVFDEEIAVMRLGMRDRLMQPAYLLDKVATQSQGIADTPAEKSPFVIPVEKFPASISDADRDSIRKNLFAAVESDVLPAYKKFAAFVRETYAPAGRKEAGIWALPNGAELYRNAIREHVQTSLTPEQIHREGLRQVGRIQVEMLKLAEAQGFHDLSSFHAHILADPKLHGTSGDQLMKLYQGYEEQARAKILEVVPTAPGVPLEVVPMDSFRAPTDVPADYSPGSSSGGRPGRVNVNLYNPTGRLLLNVEAIAYHEGMPRPSSAVLFRRRA